MAETRLTEAQNVSDDRLTIVDLKYDSIAVLRKDGRYYAFLNNCPHADAPFLEDCLHDGSVVCHLHGASFNACSGEVEAPPASSGLLMYNVTEKDGVLYIDYDE